jgi:hypothetical protein
MKNIAITRVTSVKFSSETVQGQTVYRGMNEFTHQIGERLRASLLESGLECSSVERSFKPAGSGFQTDNKPGKYIITVGVEREVLPEAKAVIMADPCRGAAKSWANFERLFRRAVESAFSGCDLAWMTEDEYVASGPSA